MPPFEVIEVPARIGLLADTHRSSRNPKPLPVDLLRALEGCDYIFHAGDLCAPAVLKELSDIATTYAVCGNNEEPPLDTQLPVELSFRIGKFVIGLVHGHIGGRTAREAARSRFAGQAEAVVYGHSHQPEIERRDGLLMVNPGSPTQRRFAPEHTYAIMQVTDEIVVDLYSIS